MNLKKSVLATALAGALALGAAGPATASIYARSYLDISNLIIDVGTIGADGSFSAAPPTVRGFNFELNNRAALNGVPGLSTNAVCSGIPTNNTCEKTSPRLDAGVVNAPGNTGTTTRSENTFNFFGPGNDEYANSDSVIRTAQLTLDPSTSTQQIAEAELQSGTSASSGSEISSTTGFTFQFTVEGQNVLQLTFNALHNILARIDAPTAQSAEAQANVRVQFTLTKDDGSAFLSWTPNSTGNTCLAGGTTSCVVLNDQFDLNTDVGVTTDGTNEGRSNTVANDAFGIRAFGLDNGNWTLTLNAVTSTLVTQRSAVPEPGTLALLGLGLAGIGAAARRNKKRRA